MTPARLIRASYRLKYSPARYRFDRVYSSKLAAVENDGKFTRATSSRVALQYSTGSWFTPRPVASPSVRSLTAALNPAATDYLYYVRNPDRDDGAHNFYSNESDFQRGVQALRDWERARDARLAASPPVAGNQ